MPFGESCEYQNFAACVHANSGKDDPEAYCAALMRATEGRCRRRGMVAAWRKAARVRRSTAIYQIADRLEPVMRRQFLAAVERLKGRVDLDALAAAIQARDLSQAQRILNIDGWPAELRRTADVIRQVFERTGTVAATQLSDQLGTAMSFDLTNPRAVQWGRRESSRLISEVTESTREAVRQIIGDAIEQGIPPRESARLIREQVGLTRQQSDAVFRRWLDLTESGRPGADVTRLTDRYAQQLTKYRAEVIARTETIAASTNGQQETWRQAVDKGYLDPETTRRVWIVTPDDRLCLELCAPMDKQEVELEEDFEVGDGSFVLVPPAHPQCRCAVALSFKRRAEAA